MQSPPFGAPSAGEGLPPLVHVRAPAGGAPPRADGVDPSARAIPVEVLRRELQGGVLPPETEVFFAGLADWTPANAIARLWVPSTALAEGGAVGAAQPVDGEELASLPLSPSIPVGSVSVAPPRRRGFGALAVFGAVGGALVLLALGALAIYFVYFRYEPVALQHLPRKCVVAGRVELLDWALFGPLRDRIVPAIADAAKSGAPPTPPPAGPPLIERLQSLAGVRLDRDVREVAFCAFEDTTPSANDAPPDPLYGVRAVIAVGGRIRRGAVPGLYEALKSESFGTSLRLEGSGDAAVIRMLAPVPGVLGQAEDGTLVYAPDDAALAASREARPVDDARATTALRQTGAIELSGQHMVFAAIRYLTPAPPFDSAMFEALAKVHQGRFAITLGRAPAVELTLEAKTEADAHAAEDAARGLLTAGQRELATAKKDYSGEHAAIAGARVTRDEARLEVRLDFRLEDVDRGAVELAGAIRDPASTLRAKVLPMFVPSAGGAPAAPGSSSGSPDPSDPPGDP